MVEIKHRETGNILHIVDADTLQGAILREQDLRDADLHGANLEGADLTKADLFGADLREANLSQAILNEAKLMATNLDGACLNSANLIMAVCVATSMQGADLRNASLKSALLSSSFLQGANLRGADLLGAYLTMMHLKGADLTDARFQGTVLSACFDFHEAIGLAEVKHGSHSVLDMFTLRHCVNDLPDTFLEGCGYTRYEIDSLRQMYADKDRQFYSCFLSHAEKDSSFVERLRIDLIARNISCWHYRYDQRGGGYFRSQINEAIKEQDKLIVVCSKRSLVRLEVIEEIIVAIEAERKTQKQKLFPIRLDNFIFSKDMDQTYEKLPPRQRREDWLTYIRAYYIPDFRKWKDELIYKQEFEKLVRDLENPAPR